MRQGALAFVTAILAAGCGVEDGLTRWTDGLVDNLETSADTIGSNLGGGLVRGARDSLTSPESSARLTSLIDSLVGAALYSAQRNSPALVDSLLGPSLQRSVDSLVGILRRQTGGLRDDLLGARTRAYLEALRDTLLGAGTRERVGLLRDELLGPSTRSAVMTLVDSILQGPVRKYQAGLQAAIHTEAGFVQQNTVAVIILIAVLAAGVIGFFWWQRRRYRQMLHLLTRQIHDIDDEQAFSELTGRIQQSAQRSGLERALEKELASEGLLGDATRRRRTRNPM